MISFGVWVAGLFGKAVTTQQAKRLGLAVAAPLIIAALVLLTLGGKALYDRGIREQVQQQRDATVAKGVVEADRAADEEQANRLAEAEAENDRLENAMADAKQGDPKKGQTEVGPVQQSYFDNLPDKKRRK